EALGSTKRQLALKRKRNSHERLVPHQHHLHIVAHGLERYRELFDNTVLCHCRNVDGKHVASRITIGLTLGVDTPLAVFGIEDDGPGVRTRYRPEAVFSTLENLSLECQILVRFKSGGFVGSGAPHLTVRHQASKYLPALLVRSVVKKRNVKVAPAIADVLLRAERFLATQIKLHYGNNYGNQGYAYACNYDGAS